MSNVKKCHRTFLRAGLFERAILPRRRWALSLRQLSLLLSFSVCSCRAELLFCRLPGRKSARFLPNVSVSVIVRVSVSVTLISPKVGYILRTLGGSKNDNRSRSKTGKLAR